MNQTNQSVLSGRPSLGTLSLLHEELSDSDLSSFADVLEHVAGLFGQATEISLADIDDFRAAGTALASAWNAVATALRQGGRAAEQVLAADTLVELVERIGASARAITVAERRRQESMFTRAREALGSIQELSGMSQLIEAAPRALCSIGFDRSLLSSIEYSTWLTDAAHIDDDDEWAQAIVDVGRAAPQAIIPGLPETEVVRSHQPIVVTRAHERHDVHKAVIEAAAGRSYVAAPLMPRSKVVGFLHCDRIFHRGDVDEFDAQVLGVFAQGLSFAIERAITLRDLDDLRTHVRGFTQGVESFVRGAKGSGQAVQLHQALAVDPVASLPPRTESAPRYTGGGRSESLDLLLTRRELEVLSVMAEGENNQRIATRLFIADETVKSHVKNILRKLHVTSRAEAVARWHNSMNRP